MVCSGSLRNGNQVTPVDCCPAMLDIASGRADAAGASASMDFVNSEVLDLPKGIGALPAVMAPVADGALAVDAHRPTVSDHRAACVEVRSSKPVRQKPVRHSRGNRR